MKNIKKKETLGMIGSVGIMALALYVITNDEYFWEKESTSETEIIEEVIISEKTESEQSLEKALLEAVDKNGNVVKLVVLDTRLGEGEGVKDGDVIVSHYIGATQESGRFDSSYERGEPFVFRVGVGTVIEGWDKGVIGMKVGGQRVLVIPSDMAYGNMQVGNIPPNTPLIFSLELLEIR
jgi:peptidylprolyl isomerase